MIGNMFGGKAIASAAPNLGSAAGCFFHTAGNFAIGGGGGAGGAFIGGGLATGIGGAMTGGAVGGALGTCAASIGAACGTLSTGGGWGTTFGGGLGATAAAGFALAGNADGFEDFLLAGGLLLDEDADGAALCAVVDPPTGGGGALELAAAVGVGAAAGCFAGGVGLAAFATFAFLAGALGVFKLVDDAVGVEAAAFAGFDAGGCAAAADCEGFDADGTAFCAAVGPPTGGEGVDGVGVVITLAVFFLLCLAV